MPQPHITARLVPDDCHYVEPHAHATILKLQQQLAHSENYLGDLRLQNCQVKRMETEKLQIALDETNRSHSAQIQAHKRAYEYQLAKLKTAYELETNSLKTKLEKAVLDEKLGQQRLNASEMKLRQVQSASLAGQREQQNQLQRLKQELARIKEENTAAKEALLKEQELMLERIARSEQLNQQQQVQIVQLQEQAVKAVSQIARLYRQQSQNTQGNHQKHLQSEECLERIYSLLQEKDAKILLAASQICQNGEQTRKVLNSMAINHSMKERQVDTGLVSRLERALQLKNEECETMKIKMERWKSRLGLAEPFEKRLDQIGRLSEAARQQQTALRSIFKKKTTR